MKPLVEIPEPCHESWEEMSKEEKGKFCGKCSKVVLDFTTKTNSEIAEILISNSGNRVCGRVRNDQLITKSVNPSKPAKKYRIFFAALYFVFGGILFTSCNSTNDNSHTVGEMVPIPDSIIHVDSNQNSHQNIPSIDSTKYRDSVKSSHHTKNVKDTTKTICVPNDDKIMGIMVMPHPPKSDTIF